MCLSCDIHNFIKLPFPNLSFTGDHGKFKILTQPDDFDDDLGKALVLENLEDVQSFDLHDEFDDGMEIIIYCSG